MFVRIVLDVLADAQNVRLMPPVARTVSKPTRKYSERNWSYVHKGALLKLDKGTVLAEKIRDLKLRAIKYTEEGCTLAQAAAVCKVNIGTLIG